MGDRTVVVTGIGSVTAAGFTEDLWQAAVERRCCLERFTEGVFDGCPAEFVGRVNADIGDLFPRSMKRYVSRHALLGAAALLACEEFSGVTKAEIEDAGLLFGSASQGQDQMEQLAHELLEQPFGTVEYRRLDSASDAGACHLIACAFGLRGHVHAVQGASCSGMIALSTACSLIKSGAARRIFCVVGEGNLFPATMLFYSRRARIGGVAHSFFGSSRVTELRQAASHVVPYCVPEISDRGSLGEAGAAVLLESRESAESRGARVLAILEDAACHFYTENHHGRDSTMVGLKAALDSLSSRSFDSVYAPVTGSTILDFGLNSVCSERFAGTHTFTVEPLIGHTGAASSLLNTALAAMSLHHGLLLPTANLRHESLDASFRLSPSLEPVPISGRRRILVVSSGWGGYNGACSLAATDR